MAKRRKKISKPPERLVKKSWLSFLTMWNIIVFISVIGGLGVLHLTLKPKITVEPDLRRVPNNPFATSFKVRNDGYLPIMNVEFEYGLKNIFWKRSQNRIIDSIVKYGDNKISILKPNQTETAFRLSTPIYSDEPATSADIEIVVSFKDYWPPPWKGEMKFGFTLTTALDGSQHWQHKVIN